MARVHDLLFVLSLSFPCNFEIQVSENMQFHQNYLHLLYIKIPFQLINYV